MTIVEIGQFFVSYITWGRHDNLRKLMTLGDRFFFAAVSFCAYETRQLHKNVS